MADLTEQREVEKQDAGISFASFMLIGAGISLGLIALILLGGVGLAIFADPQQTSLRISSIKDTLIIIMALEGILIVVALTTLVLQTTRLVVLLRNESFPIFNNARETTEIARGTALFVGKNFVRPIISINTLITILFGFIREISGIRRAIRPSETALDKTEQK